MLLVEADYVIHWGAKPAVIFPPIACTISPPFATMTSSVAATLSTTTYRNLDNRNPEV
jgi:hypothetical protein